MKTMKTIVNLTETEDLKGRTLLYFSAPWCVPCQSLSPVLEDAAKNNPRITFLKIDVSETPKIAQRFKVMSIPTLIMVMNGKIIDQKISPSLDQVEAMLSNI